MSILEVDWAQLTYSGGVRQARLYLKFLLMILSIYD